MGRRELAPAVAGLAVGLALLAAGLRGAMQLPPAPYFEYPVFANEPTFEAVKGADRLLPAAPAAFEVVHRMKITAFGDHDAGYGGCAWALGGDEAGGSCGWLIGMFNPKGGKGTSCPCAIGFAVQCATDGRTFHTTEKFEFGVEYTVAYRVDPAGKQVAIIVDGVTEATLANGFGSFPRDGSLTLLAGDHNLKVGKTEDLKGAVWDFAVFAPPVPIGEVGRGWGWPFLALAAGVGLLYIAGGAALVTRARAAPGRRGR
jgi:hypothetical protein